ncbi:hypothetical protein RUND412_003540 [Rhizina undulata]
MMLPRIPHVSAFLRQSSLPLRRAATAPRHFSTSLPGLHRSLRQSPRTRPTAAKFVPPSKSKFTPEPEEEEEIETEHLPTREKGAIISTIFFLIAAPIVFVNTLTESPQLASYCGVSEGQRHVIREYMVKNFSLVPFMFTSPDVAAPWWTLITHQFSHTGLFHFLFGYIALKSFAPALATMYGAGRTVGVLLASGTMAGALNILYYKLQNPYASLTEAELNRLLHAKKPDGTKFVEDRDFRLILSPHLGSSGAIVGMVTICALIAPALQVNLMFIPYGIAIRNCVLGFAAFDLGGVFYDYGLGIAHIGHLGGNIAGLLLYLFWLRRIPSRYILTFTKKAGGR